MNVLPVLADLSPSIKTDSSAPGDGSSVGGFARILDSALSSPAPSSQSAPPAAPRAPYEPPRTTGEEKEPAASPAKREAKSQEAARNAVSPNRGTRKNETRAANRPSGKTEATNRQVKENGGPAGSSTKGSGTKPANPQKGSSQVPVQKTVQDKKSAQADKAGKDPHGKKAAATGKERPIPFPGAIVLGGAKKGGHTPLDEAVRHAAKITEPTAKDTTLVGAPVEKRQAKAAVGEKPQKGEKKASRGPGSKSSQIAAQIQPGPGLLTVSGSSVQPAAAANAAQEAPAGRPGHPAAAPTPAQEPANAAPALTVIDLRHSGQSGSSTADPRGGKNQSGESAALRLFQLAGGGTSGSTSPGAPVVAARVAGAPFAGNGFSTLTDHIVKQTGILLKDNNSGEIRLVLKPENLGQLRIKIDMVNNNLTGKIFVQNHDALRLVQQNLDGLYRALRESGFTASQLNVSVGGRESREREKARSSPLPLVRAVEGVRGFDSQVPAMEAVGGAHSLVNLVI